MVEFRITHPDHPEDAAAKGVELLQHRHLMVERNGDLIAILNPDSLDRAVALLKQAGFEVHLPGSYADY